MRFLTNSILYLLLTVSMSCSAAGMAAPKTSTSSPEAAASDAAATTGSYPTTREYHLKAAFLRYVAKYIEWPKDSVKDGNVNICVLGQIPSFDGLNSINGKVVNDLTIVVRKILSIDDTNSCQLVFVSATETDDIPKIVSKLAKKPILTFGDMPGFAEKGGAMNFYIANNRLAIMVNLPPIGEANLKVNPQMLRLVTIVP